MTIDPKAVEAVAKAIADAHWPEDRGQMSVRDWECWLEEAQAAITAYHAYLAEQGLVIQQGWRPIEDASKDGKDFLALCVYQKRHHQMVGCFAPDGKFRSWPARVIYHPTHFMPLPSPPAEQGDSP